MEEIEIDLTGIPPLHANDRYPAGIERIASQNLTYNDFFKHYLHPNCAVIVTSVATDWECFNHWIDRTTTPARLNVEYLKKTLPNVDVPIADCDEQFYNSHRKIELRLHDFLNNWAANEVDEPPEQAESRSRYYLKDWHLCSTVPEYSFYQTPAFFASDWLNEYLLEKGTDDYRFVYMGPKGTWTGFHADVFGSYSWSVNVFGRKRWYMLPPGEERKLKNAFGNLPFSVTEQILREAEVTFYTICQQPGEAVFVPSGWYHQVLNVEDAISVNHNWFNGCNVRTIWSNLCRALLDVRREIEDCRDMDNFEQHCQVMLKADFGMDYREFLTIVFYICDKRLEWIKQQVNGTQFAIYELGKRHTYFDIVVIRELLSEIVTEHHLAFDCNLLVLTESYLKKITASELSLK